MRPKVAQITDRVLKPALDIVKSKLKQAIDIYHYAKNQVSSGYQFEKEFSTFLLSE